MIFMFIRLIKNVYVRDITVLISVYQRSEEEKNKKKIEESTPPNLRLSALLRHHHSTIAINESQLNIAGARR